MYIMFVTSAVLNDDRLSEVREEQPLNMLNMLVTAAVLNDDRSSEARETQP